MALNTGASGSLADLLGSTELSAIPPSSRDSYSGIAELDYFEARIALFQETGWKTLENFWEQQSEKFDLIFQVLCRFQSKQAELEMSINYLQTFAPLQGLCKIVTCQDALAAMGVTEEDAAVEEPTGKSSVATPETHTPRSASASSQEDVPSSSVISESASASSHGDIPSPLPLSEVSQDFGAASDAHNFETEAVGSGGSVAGGSLGSASSSGTDSKNSGNRQTRSPSEYECERAVGNRHAFAPVCQQPSPPIGVFPMSPCTGAVATEKDRNSISVLAATGSRYYKLWRTACRLPEILLERGGDASSNMAGAVELYGSLSLQPPASFCGVPDWPTYYVNKYSDVDFAVELRPGFSAESVAQRILSGGDGKWRMIKETQVSKFDTTQYTFLGSFDDEDDANCEKVHLDISCIMSHVHFQNLQKRQEAFRNLFFQLRSWLESQFAMQGALAFDAYIHLLKAFAAKTSTHALTGFQATCIGLFSLQICNYTWKADHSIAISLFEGFLRLCATYFSATALPDCCNYRFFAMDLSAGGRWLPRTQACWESELYFMDVEDTLYTQQEERFNVAHSLDPAGVCFEAQRALANLPCSCNPSSDGSLL